MEISDIRAPPLRYGSPHSSLEALTTIVDNATNCKLRVVWALMKRVPLLNPRRVHSDAATSWNKSKATNAAIEISHLSERGIEECSAGATAIATLKF